MKKLILLVIIVSLLPLVGCSASRRELRRMRRIKNAEYYQKIQGWEYVRVEKKIPCKGCRYIIQEACGEKDASRCYNWYKQEAKFYGGNTVVVTEDVRSQKAYGSSSVMGSSNAYGSSIGGGGSFQSAETMAALADFYECPAYDPGEQK